MSEKSQRRSNVGFKNLLPLLFLVLTICSTHSLALPSRNGMLTLTNSRASSRANGGDEAFAGRMLGGRTDLLIDSSLDGTTPAPAPATSRRRSSLISNLFNIQKREEWNERNESNHQFRSTSHPLSKRSDRPRPRERRSRDQQQLFGFGSSWSSKSSRSRSRINLVASKQKHSRHQSAFLLRKDTSSSSPNKSATCKSKASNASANAGNDSSSSASSSSSSSSSSTPKATSTSNSSGSGSDSNNSNGGGGISNSKNGNGMIMAGYWPEWAIGTLAPEDIDFSKFDFIDYAFVTPSSAYDLAFSDPSSSPAILKRMVTAAHKGDSKVVISIGGWGGGEYFSPAVGDASSRSTFVDNIVKFYEKYNLDGIDIDWEYPNSNAAGNSKTSPEDAANFQTFLGELRTALPSGALLTAAVSHLPFIGSNGSPVKSVARAASALDYILIMNYDVWGSSGKPGPNAPLANLCGNSTQPSASAAAGVKQWSAAGMPRSKILLGVPSYGYVSKSSSTRLKSRVFDQDVEPRSDVPSGHPGRYDPRFSAAAFESMRKSSGGNEKRLLSGLLSGTTSARTQSGNVLASSGPKSLKSGDGSTSSGQIQFNQILSQGGLKTSGKSFVQGSGWTKKWDDCSDTPFLTSGDQVITYDDTDSLYDKAAFSVLSGIAGVNMFSIDGDTKDWALTNSLINGMADSFNQ